MSTLTLLYYCFIRLRCGLPLCLIYLVLSFQSFLILLSIIINKFILHKILEQTHEWRAALIILFIDFEKAFNSVHRDSLWYIMKSNGIPSKIIKTIKGIYTGFKCTVIDQGETSEWFSHRLDHAKNNRRQNQRDKMEL